MSKPNAANVLGLSGEESMRGGARVATEGAATRRSGNSGLEFSSASGYHQAGVDPPGIKGFSESFVVSTPSGLRLTKAFQIIF